MADLSPEQLSILEIIGSSLASYGSSSAPSPTAVRAAETHLEQVKASLSVRDSIVLANALLSPVVNGPTAALDAQQERLTHFGFHLLEVCALVENWSTAVDSRDRTKLRQLALGLLVRCSTDTSRALSPRFVRTKVAELIVALAVREWGGLWDDFLVVITALGRDNPGCRDVVCDVFKSLSDEVYEFGDKLSSKRRASLAKSLKDAVNDILLFLSACSEHFFATKDENGLCGALAAFESLLSWCDMGDALRQNVPSACLSMLVHTGRVRSAALEALAVICSRKVAQNASAVAISKDPATVLIRQRVFPGFLEAVKNIPALRRVVSDSMLPGTGSNYFATPGVAEGRSAPEVIDSEDHEFLVRFMYVATELAVTHFGVCFLPFELPTSSDSQSSITDAERAIAFAFVDLLLCGVSHPSVAVCQKSSRFFAGAFATTKKSATSSVRSRKSKNRKSTGKAKAVDPSHGSIEAADATEAGRRLMSTMVFGIVDAAPFALLNHPNDILARHFADIDFEGDEEEKAEAIRQLRSHVVGALSSASAARSVDSLGIALHRFAAILDIATRAGELSPSFFETAATLPVVVSTCSAFGLAIQGKDEQMYPWVFPPFTGSDGALVLALLQAVVLTTEPVVAGASSANAFSVGTLAADFQALFDRVAGMKDPALHDAKVRAFRMFIPLFIADKTRLETALNALVAVISAGGPPTNARFDASQSLAALCRRVCNSENSKKKSGEPSSLVGIRQPLCSFAASVLTASNRSMREKAQLLEAAVTCLLTLGSVDEQTLWLNDLLLPLLEAIDPSQEWFKSSFQSPVSLLGFLERDHGYRQAFSQAKLLLEAVSHQIVRNASRNTAPISLPNPLSQSVAPLCVDVSVQLITVLHSLYNVTTVGGLVGGPYPSVLLPSSREVACLLHLTSITFLNSNSAPEFDVHGVVVDAKKAEQFDDMLRQVGIEPLRADQRRTVESLRLLRCGAYELVRNSLLSGVTQSPDHLGRLVAAISTDYQYLEPIHLYYLVQRVLTTMLSKSVVSADDRFVASLSSSQGLCGILRLFVEQIEGISSSIVSTSNNAALDIAREHGRLSLCCVGLDLLVKAFGPLDEEERCCVPKHMENDSDLSLALWKTFKTLCSPLVASADFPSSRGASILIAKSVVKVRDCFAVHYSNLLVACFQTDVYMFSKDPTESCFTQAVLEVAVRFPSESTEALGLWMQGEKSDVKSWITAAFIALLAAPIDKKKGRSTLRKLVERLSVESGLSSAPKPKIINLPSKTGLAKRRGSAAQTGDVELVLGDEALDSLFGSGPPL